LQTENEDVLRIRRRAADLSIGFGVAALLAAAFGGLSPVLPGELLCVVGGGVAVGVYRAATVELSRRFTMWAAGLTALGVAQIALAIWLIRSAAA
jgi:hypothetical protein